MPTWGDLLLDELGRATKRATFVAPFIKQGAFARLLRAVPETVPVRVFTRWRPDEVAAGVSDLEVLDVVAARPGTTLLLYAGLHAKCFLIDERCFVGSANLTGAALGWSQSPNLEILVPVALPHPSVDAVLGELERGAIAATDAVRASVAAAAAMLPRPLAPPPTELARRNSGPAFLPTTRNPEQLLVSYLGDSEELTTAAREQTTEDLAMLGLPPGLQHEQARAFVGVLLLQSPIVAAVDVMLATPRRFGEVRDVLAARLQDEEVQRDPSEAWQTLMRWLLYFLPRRYQLEVFNYSEVVRRRDS